MTHTVYNVSMELTTTPYCIDNRPRMMLKSVMRSHCWLMRRLSSSSSSSVDRLCVENAFPRQGLETLKSFRETKFDESVDVSLRLNLDPRKPNQAIRKQVRLPHGMYTDRV